MANATRFTTVELGELERRIATAADKALALELECFAELVALASAAAEAIAAAAAALALLDVAAGLADLAVEGDYCRPMVDESAAFEIKAGRHPVVEAALRAQQGGAFVANDCDLGAAQRLWLLTGPNMAGKSTFLRQNALIALMAQIGSYVPASRAPDGNGKALAASLTPTLAKLKADAAEISALKTTPSSTDRSARGNSPASAASTTSRSEMESDPSGASKRDTPSTQLLSGGAQS
jgi:hypothetical protein